MKRTITTFFQDSDAHWAARLDCGHAQHTRHDPPLTDRPWVLTPEGRASRVGVEVDCLRCARFELPDGAKVYRSTPVFDADTLPRGLLADHSTRAGVWAHVRVLDGAISYVVHPPLERTWRLTPERAGVVVPEVLHHLEIVGPVSLQIDFLRRDDGA